MEAAQWPAEGSRVSATARALGRKGRATASGPAANRWPRTAARRSISAPRGAGSGRVCGPRMRTARAGSGGRPCGKPIVVGVCGTLSLFGQPGALRFEPALLGTESPTGTGLLAVDLARLEDETARPLDWLERSAKAAPSTMDCEQRQIPDSALGPRQRTGEQDPGARCAATSSGLAKSLRPSSAAVGNPRGC